MSDMSVVTNKSFAHRGFIAFFFRFLFCFIVSFCIFFSLTMKISGMNLHAMEFDSFFFPFVKLLGEWEEKMWENDFSLFRWNKGLPAHKHCQTWHIRRQLSMLSWKHGKNYPSSLCRPSYEDEWQVKFSLWSFWTCLWKMCHPHSLSCSRFPFPFLTMAEAGEAT